MLNKLGLKKGGLADKLTEVPPKEKTVPRINDFQKNANHQADLLFLPHDRVKNKTYKYALVVVDTSTKAGDAEPLTSKKPTDVLAAFKRIYKRQYLSTPTVRLETDPGAEFKGAVDTWLESKGIFHKVTRTNRHRGVALAEAMNKFLGRYTNLQQHDKEIKSGDTETSREWVKVLPLIVEGYNEHVEDKTKRNDETMDKKMKNLPTLRCKGKNCLLLSKDTEVRVILDMPKDVSGKRLHGNFRAGDRRWDQVIRKINKVVLKAGQPPMYAVTGIDNALYTREQLQVVGKEDEGHTDTNQKWIVEKLVKVTAKNGQIYYEVKWKDFPSSDNTTQSRAQLMEDVPKLVKFDYEKDHKKQVAEVKKDIKQKKTAKPSRGLAKKVHQKVYNLRKRKIGN